MIITDDLYDPWASGPLGCCAIAVIFVAAMLIGTLVL